MDDRQGQIFPAVGSNFLAILAHSLEYLDDPERQKLQDAVYGEITGEGIENCEAIAAVDGIDDLLTGSRDLTTDLGIRDRSTIHGCAPPMSAWRRPVGPITGCWGSGASATTPRRKVN